MNTKFTVKQINFLQGSPEWLAHRLNHYNASEAAAMLGCGLHMTRDELIHQKATGVIPEVSEWVQRYLFDKGHEFEALARTIAEDIVGDTLYPITLATDGADLPLSSSLDGITLDMPLAERVSWEHKRMNRLLDEALSEGVIPPEYHPQLEQGLMLSGAKRCLFMASLGTPETAKWAWYSSDPGLRAKLLAGWAQLDKDKNVYVPEAPREKLVADAIADLPAVAVQISGALQIASNLDIFETALRDFIASKLIREPETDQDFVDLDAQIKALKKAEDLLDGVEQQAMAQVAPIDEIKRLKDALKKLTRDNRLAAEKLLKERKDAIRAAQIARGRDALAEHIAQHNVALGRALMPKIAENFAGAIRSLKTIDSLKNAINTELARCKIEADGFAATIAANLAQLGERRHLCPDLAAICTKPAEDFAALIELRQRQADEAEAKRRAEAEARRAEELARQAQASAAAAVAVAAPASPAIAAQAEATIVAARSIAPAPAATVIAAPAATHTGITGTGKLRDMIDDHLATFDANQLQRVLDFCRSIAPQKVAA